MVVFHTEGGHMHLFVVESPGKVSKLQTILDGLYGRGSFVVAATVGHFRGLPDMDGQSFGDVVDVNTFEERHVVHKTDVRTRLVGLAKRVDTVVLATDADREGEAIAWHVAQELRIDPKRARRVRFTEITAGAVKSALDAATGIDLALVDAQRSRQVLDYELGLELSRRLWRFGARSAGRVQSAAVRILVDRENAIQAFKAVAYVSVQATYVEGFEAVLKTPRAQTAVDGVEDADVDDDVDVDDAARSDEKAKAMTVRRFLDAREAKAAADVARTRAHAVEDVRRISQTRRPRPPFNTATLQAAAAAELGFDAKKTARVAQALFEKGLITYIRTDSTALAEEALAEIRSELQRRFPLLLPSQPQRYADKKGAQGAHEAIRPVHMQNAEAAALEGDELALYEAIWWRTLSCQASNASIDKTTVIVAVDGLGEDRFVAEAAVVVKPGFLAIEAARPIGKRGAAPAFEALGLPHALVRGAALKVRNIDEKGGTTKPPKRFTEASLTTYLKKRGIGRPATYATTLSTIVERGYVERTKGMQLRPTEHGCMADTLLRASFDSLTREEFTASCERNFDAIAEGKVARVAFLKKFHEGFSRLLLDSKAKLDAFGSAHAHLDREAIVVDTAKCPKCGGERHMRNSKNGRIAVCQVCKDVQLKEPKVLSKCACHRDAAHGKMARVSYEKNGKPAHFFKCLTCSYSSPTEAPPPPCPLCAAPMRQLEGKSGAFWGCSAYKETGCRGSAPLEERPPGRAEPARERPAARRKPRKRTPAEEASA